MPRYKRGYSSARSICSTFGATTGSEPGDLMLESVFTPATID